ncbi:hypothetical protein SDRG_11700 [Saprolegnia diclina VS20]|uniref:FHA domain-containing protein n=1 Tax=Saprolegnia diclina (strain VS20) TaxID=1156394 RepID=T0QAU1_SAPDV|nr:hypothetical protein SDRG_11700 [Saprolegnia diclina VS20]EQC30645.1 hypothetical protein SDRG_11700 [Saprolegnia diclina VS20]|eukprot:XP_008615971.1 hypothetical protein SDRG_11700 [Saprolegnia diclina VS20]
MKRSQSPYLGDVKRVRRGSVDGTFEYAGFDMDMENLSVDDAMADDDEENDNEVAKILAGRDDGSILPRMAISVRSFTPIELSIAETVGASQSPDRLTLSPRTEARIQSRSFYLELHEGTLHRLSRAQRQAMQAAGLLFIPLTATSPTIAFTREWLTRGAMAEIYGPYKQYLSRKGSVTVEWTRQHYAAEISVTNGSKNNVFIDKTRLAPQGQSVLLHEETIKILTTPYAQRVVLGYTLHEGLLESSAQGVAHNHIAVLFAHPIAMYPSFSMTLAGLEYRAMLTELAKNLQSSANVSKCHVESDGSVVLAPRPLVQVMLEFATPMTVQELCADGCRVMHFVCHVDHQYVLLEDGVGGGTRVARDEMRGILAHSSVELVQVTSYDKAASSHRFFLQCGVPHVIAMHPSSKADSDTTMTFTKVLHASLAAGRTIQDAFDAAQHFIALLGHATTRFVLYPEDACHDVTLFPPSPPEPLAQSSAARYAAESPSTHVLGSVTKHFHGRLDEAQVVCRMLMGRRRPRWVSILGPRRVGKSQFVLAVAQYIGQRKVFGGGIVYINIPLELRYQSHDAIRASVLDVFEMLEHELGKWQHVLVILDGYESFSLSSQLEKELEPRVAKHHNISFLATGLDATHVPTWSYTTETLKLPPLAIHGAPSAPATDDDLEDLLRVPAMDYARTPPPVLWAPETPPPALPTPRSLTTKPSCAIM